jgi:hypothetical protein
MGFAVKKLTEWQRRIQGLNFYVPPGCLALWAGLEPDEAQRLALARNRKTLGMTPDGIRLNQGDLHQQMERDFGKDYTDEKRAVWTWASQKLVARSSGSAAVFVREGCLRIEEGMKRKDLEKVQKKILFDEMMDLEIAGHVFGNGHISEVIVTEFNDKLEAVYTYPVPVSKEWS